VHTILKEAVELQPTLIGVPVSLVLAGSKVVFHKGKGRLAAGRGEALSSAKASALFPVLCSALF